MTNIEAMAWFNEMRVVDELVRGEEWPNARARWASRSTCRPGWAPKATP